MGTVTTKLPAVQRSRPIDATGWFWSFVLLIAGLFYSQIWPIVGIAILLASPVCFIWQFKKWTTDSTIVKNATRWCERYYPNAGSTPVVDFMIAVAHATNPDFDKWSPSTSLDVLNWMSDDDQAEYWYPDAQDRTQAWLCNVIADAKITSTDLSNFSGTTLGDAINVFLTVHKTC
jgi:hypothetical protein